MKIQYCIIAHDEAGETIQVFDTLEQANEFASSSKNSIGSIEHPCVGGEVEDNVPKKTWRDRLKDKGDVINGILEWKGIYDCGKSFDEDWNEHILPIFQQELDRIKTSFMTEFTDQDTGLLNIGKCDHERIINFINNEIR